MGIKKGLIFIRPWWVKPGPLGFRNVGLDGFSFVL